MHVEIGGAVEADGGREIGLFFSLAFWDDWDDEEDFEGEQGDACENEEAVIKEHIK